MLQINFTYCGTPQTLESNCLCNMCLLTVCLSDFLSFGFLVSNTPHAEYYLRRTLDSLIQHSSTREQLRCSLIVYLTDNNTDFNTAMFRNLTETYMHQINIGFLQIVEILSGYYNQFYQETTALVGTLASTPQEADGLRRLSPKDAADIAYMYDHVYSQNISKYFLHLEPGLVTLEGYVDKIRQYIHILETSEWTVLDFTDMIFVGQLIRTRALHKLANTIKLFYRDTPVKHIMTLFGNSMAQKERFEREEPLFEHIGLSSSDNGIAKEAIFRKQPSDPDDPPAIVTTNMHYDVRYAPHSAYGSSPRFFWAQEPKKGDWVQVTFMPEVRLDRVVIETGSVFKPDDYIRNATLLASPTDTLSDTTCKDFEKIGTFHRGHVDVGNLHSRLKHDFTTCLRIEVEASQEYWVVIQQISVFVYKGDKLATN